MLRGKPGNGNPRALDSRLPVGLWPLRLKAAESGRKRGKMRNSYKLVMLALTVITAANGCSNMNNTQTDALAGGGIGALFGALVDRRHPGTGAAIGGISGAAIGAAVGHSEDKAEQRATAAANPQRA